MYVSVSISFQTFRLIAYDVWMWLLIIIQDLRDFFDGKIVTPYYFLIFYKNWRQVETICRNFTYLFFRGTFALHGCPNKCTWYTQNHTGVLSLSLSLSLTHTHTHTHTHRYIFIWMICKISSNLYIKKQKNSYPNTHKGKFK